MNMSTLQNPGTLGRLEINPLELRTLFFSPWIKREASNWWWWRTKKPPQAVRLAAGVAANGTRAPQRAKAAVGEASWCKKWPKGVEGALTASGQAFLHNTYTHILVLCNLRHIQYRYILYIVYIYIILKILYYSNIKCKRSGHKAISKKW